MIKNNKQSVKGKDGKLQRSRSRSHSLQKIRKVDAKQGKKLQPKTSRDKLNNKSPLVGSKNQLKAKSPPAKGLLNRSLSKSSLQKSKSNKNLKRNSSQNRIASSPTNKNLNKQLPVSPKQIRSPRKEKIELKQGKSPQQQPSNAVKTEQKEMGLIFIKPEHDKIIFKTLEITDPVFDKYLEMINNDNDANYVLNALPQLKNFKKQDETEGRDFVSGRISRLSGIFQNLSVDKIITSIKKVPNYYSGQCGNNLTFLRIMLQTKFKVEVDLGFVQYSLDGDKLTIFRIYVSKIYRRMNYLGIVYVEVLRVLMQRHPGADRWSMFILEKNMNVHKFFKYLGFHIEKIATESKNKSMDYFQQFTLKKKELSTIVASMTK